MVKTTFVSSRKGKWACAIVIVVVIIGVVSGLLYYFLNGVVFNAQKTRKASIVTNGPHCSEIGKSILERGGNAAEAAIAVAFCEGVVNPQSMGLGGGFLLTIFNKTTGEVWSLNSREVAPAAATEDMYHGNETLAQKGGLSVAVPAELIGYWYIYEKFGGNLSWKDLVQPTIDLCYSGSYVNGYIARMLKINKNNILSDPVLSDIFIDPSTNEPYLEGQYVKRLRLAKTLEVIAEEGGYALHNGSLTEGFIQDIRDNGGIITSSDLKNYRPEWQNPVRTTLSGNDSLFSAPLPGSGLVLSFILNILDNFVDSKDPNSVTTYQKIMEAFKFAYGSRTQLGDPKYVQLDELITNLSSKSYAEYIRQFIFDNQTFQNPLYYGANSSMVEDHGTAHISILAPNGDAVAITSTINFLFGAKFASNSTGIILNNQMDDFSSPNITSGYNMSPSPTNYIAPGKQPLSSMCPTIILDENNDVIMVTGAAGGTKITTTVALLIVKHIWFGMDLKSAMDDKRVHHQLFPMSITFEGPYLTEHSAIILTRRIASWGFLADFQHTLYTRTCIKIHEKQNCHRSLSKQTSPNTVCPHHGGKCLSQLETGGSIVANVLYKDQHIVEGLSKIGHNYTIQQTDGFAAATSISRDRISGQVTGIPDKRRPGTVSYLY